MPLPISLYTIRGASMSPALRDGDIALVVSGWRRSLDRGRIVAFRARIDGGETAVRVKRVVGLPGESVEFRDGSLFIDGEHFPEPYLRGLPPNAGLEAAAWTLGADEYFLMGDNRAHSSDSRHYGPARGEDAVGAVRARIPLSALSALSRLAFWRRGGRRR